MLVARWSFSALAVSRSGSSAASIDKKRPRAHAAGGTRRYLRPGGVREVCAAFDGGAAGFMPTSIEPSVALQALAFIKCGGSFFPLRAGEGLFRPEMPSVRGHVAVNGSDRANHLSDELRGCPAKLSAKQEEVFRLLRQGPSNKAIARQLGVSEATVKVHIGALCANSEWRTGPRSPSLR